MRARLYSSSGPPVEPVPRGAFPHGQAASMAFSTRLSETGYAVPSACAK
jgi:hypothetical protein